MSEKELNLTRKLFAVIERLVHESNVHDVDLHMNISEDGVSELKPGIECNTRELEFEVPSENIDMALEIETETVEILQDLIESPIYDASPQSLETTVSDENLEIFQDVEVKDYDDGIQLDKGFQVHDFFKKFNIKSKPLYTSSVKDVGIIKLSTGIKDFPLQMNVTVKENLAFFRRLTVEHEPAQLSYLPEKEQLILWKRAVEKTKKEPRQLKILGVYTGVPYHCIQTEKITINPNRKTLIYNYKLKIPKSREQDRLQDLALFTTFTGDTGGSKSSLIMVKK